MSFTIALLDDSDFSYWKFRFYSCFEGLVIDLSLLRNRYNEVCVLFKSYHLIDMSKLILSQNQVQQLTELLIKNRFIVAIPKLNRLKIENSNSNYIIHKFYKLKDSSVINPIMEIDISTAIMDEYELTRLKRINWKVDIVYNKYFKDVTIKLIHDKMSLYEPDNLKISIRKIKLNLYMISADCTGSFIQISRNVLNRLIAELNKRRLIPLHISSDDKLSQYGRNHIKLFNSLNNKYFKEFEKDYKLLGSE